MGRSFQFQAPQAYKREEILDTVYVSMAHGRLCLSTVVPVCIGTVSERQMFHRLTDERDNINSQRACFRRCLQAPEPILN